MKVVGKITIVLLLIIGSSSMFAQFDTEEVDSLDNLILYNKQRSFGIVAHNLGLGIKYRWGKRITYFKTRVFEIEFVSMKAYKEAKVINPYFANSRRYVYGKMNYAYFLRGGMMWKKLLNRKPYWGGVELRFIFGGGATIGIAKPYYYYTIYFYESPGGGYSFEIKTERFNSDQQAWDDIYGRAPFTRGLDEITLHPGVYGKAGLNFEFGKNNTKIRALEVGITMDVLPMGLEIMSGTNQIFFPTGYLSFHFGKRFNKY
jgi:hypothetical protein